MAFQVSLEKYSNRPTVDCDTRCSSFVLSPFSPICSSASVLSDAAAQDSYSQSPCGWVTAICKPNFQNAHTLLRPFEVEFPI